MTAQLTIDHLLWRMQHVHPESHVVTVSGSGRDYTADRHSFADIAGRVHALARGLRDKINLREGDVITVFGWNDREHLEMLLAVPIAGGIVNSINLRLGAANMTQLVSHPKPKAIVLSDEIAEHPTVGQEVLAAADAAHSEGVHIIRIGESETDQIGGSIRYEELLSYEQLRPWTPVVTDETVTAYLFHTSGTTGAPKTYEVSHRAALLHCLSQASADATGLSSRDRVLPLAPFFHVNGWGLPLTCALTGASLVLTGGNLKPARLAKVMNTERVTVAAAVPTVWYSVCAAINNGEASAPRDLREVLTGGDALPEGVWRSLKSTLGVQVAIAWGMTETMACSTYERDRPHERAGKPIPLVELRLQDDHSPTEDTIPGRLQVRGPFIVSGEVGPDDWFSTGDVATIDADGALTLRDREKDLIKSGGEWIASAELEHHLSAHPIVAAAAVVPVSDPRWIQRPRAYVVLTGNSDPDDNLFAVLTDHLAAKFPRWWLPDQIDIVEALPMTTVGKVNKRALRQMAETTEEKGPTLV
ncbi:AMP-binding protein [Brevibacterium sp. CFH 10365]|uniref:AMP-binding protein n=1 Tax=Brevibacterium sp. CFH 10365 TaxID=2585207 RepID=UPI0012662D91|nr:AMP-binding protein [Brevibacterium sp. CFH 10365]